MAGTLGNQTPYTSVELTHSLHPTGHSYYQATQSPWRYPPAPRHLTPTKTPNLLELGSKIRAQYLGTSSLSPPRGCQGSNSGHPACQQASLFTEPPHQPSSIRIEVVDTCTQHRIHQLPQYHFTSPYPSQEPSHPQTEVVPTPIRQYLPISLLTPPYHMHCP